MEIKDIPKKFLKYKKFLKILKKFVKEKNDKIQVCLKYALSNDYIDIIVGIDRPNNSKINSFNRYIEIQKISRC